jgi:hypothetical protein
MHNAIAKQFLTSRFPVNHECVTNLKRLRIDSLIIWQIVGCGAPRRSSGRPDIAGLPAHFRYIMTAGDAGARGQGPPPGYRRVRAGDRAGVLCQSFTVGITMDGLQVASRGVAESERWRAPGSVLRGIGGFTDPPGKCRSARSRRSARTGAPSGDSGTQVPGSIGSSTISSRSSAHRNPPSIPAALAAAALRRRSPACHRDIGDDDQYPEPRRPPCQLSRCQHPESP